MTNYWWKNELWRQQIPFIDFCAPEPKHSLVGYDSLMKNFPILNHKKVYFLSFSLSLHKQLYDNFWSKKKFSFHSPMGHKLALVSDSTAIDHSSRDSFQLVHFECFTRFFETARGKIPQKNFADFIYNSASRKL